MKPVIRKTLAGVLTSMMTSAGAYAGVTIDVTDTGADIVVTASGTLNLTDLTESIGSFLASGTGIIDYGGDLGSSQGLVLGASTQPYTLRSGPTFFGPPYPFFGAERSSQTQLFFSSATGDLISLGYSGSVDRVGIAVSNTYVNGDPLSATGILSDLELSRLGVAGSTSYTWTWGSGASSDFLTINVIPEPAHYALMLAGLALVGLAARYRKPH